MNEYRVTLTTLCLLWSGWVSAQTAAPFCLISDTGNHSCFYHSLQGCQQASISLGGICASNGGGQNRQQPPASAYVPRSSVLDGIRHVQEAGEAGRREGERRRESRLRAELIESQIAREKAEAVRSALPQASGGASNLQKCMDSDGVPLYSPVEVPGMTCSQVVATAAGSVAPPRGWLLHDEGEGRAVYLREEWKRKEQFTEIWMLTDYEKPRQAPGVAGWFSSAMGLLRIDCEKELLLSAYVVLYRGRAGEGGVLEDYDYQNEVASPIAPDSLGEYVHSLTCKSSPPKE